MKQRYIRAFSTYYGSDAGKVPLLDLRVATGGRRFILKVAGLSTEAQPRYNRVSLGMDGDEAWGFGDWFHRALLPFPTTGYRSLYTLGSGKIFGIETADGRGFSVLVGKALGRDWGAKWQVRSEVRGYQLDELADALDALLPRHPARRL